MSAAGEYPVNVTLAKACAQEVLLPVFNQSRARGDGEWQAVKWELIPDFGRSLVKLTLPAAIATEIEVTCQDCAQDLSGNYLAGNSGDQLTLQAEDGQVVDCHDPQRVFKNAQGAKWIGRLAC